jgi:ClpP class serine protease
LKKLKTKIENHNDKLSKLIQNRKVRNTLAKSFKEKSVNKPPIFLIRFDPRDKEDAFRKLEQDVNAVILNSRAGAQVFLSIYSPGGSVTVYANAAAQIERLRTLGIGVTAFVDEVAASGGYMMACVADRIVANPMAFVGSIGVVGTVPVIEALLTRVGIHVEEFTGGVRKRSVVPYKQPTQEDRDTVAHKVEGLHTAFKQHVQRYRPQVTEAIMDGDYFMAKDHVGTLVDGLGDFNTAVLGQHVLCNPIYMVRTEVQKGFNLRRLFGFDTLAEDMVDRAVASVTQSRFDF